MLDIEAYRSSVALDEPFLVPVLIMDDEVPALLTQLVTELLTSTPATAFAMHLMPEEHLEERELLRALLTIRQPRPWLTPSFHIRMDRLLHYERCARLPLVTEAMSLPTLREVFPEIRFSAADHCSLWYGDITALRVDALVNPGHAELLGCFMPFHNCLDNQVHSLAGPRLREDCQRIILQQGRQERPGSAKITRAYHLPASFILHTISQNYAIDELPPTREDLEILASSYRSCLDLAARLPEIRSLAFSCISSGRIDSSIDLASLVGLHVVQQWLQKHPGTFERIIFALDQSDELTMYERILENAG